MQHQQHAGCNGHMGCWLVVDVGGEEGWISQSHCRQERQTFYHTFLSVSALAHRLASTSDLCMFVPSQEQCNLVHWLARLVYV